MERIAVVSVPQMKEVIQLGPHEIIDVFAPHVMVQVQVVRVQMQVQVVQV